MEAISFDEARNLLPEQWKDGLKVKGHRMPFGGDWSYDKESDELTLTGPPTDVSGNRLVPEENKS